MSTTIGPDKGGGHFEVIGGQIMRIFQVHRISIKLGGCVLHLVPTKVEVILRKSEVKLCEFVQVCLILTKLGGWRLHLGPDRSAGRSEIS